MRVFNRSLEISRKFLPAASAYRRMAKEWGGDFSLAALIAQYRHETYGDPKPDERLNGYTLGKKWLGVTLDAMQQDLADGLMCKAELLQGSCAFVRRAIRRQMPANFFGFGETK